MRIIDVMGQSSAPLTSVPAWQWAEVDDHNLPHVEESDAREKNYFDRITTAAISDDCDGPQRANNYTAAVTLLWRSVVSLTERSRYGLHQKEHKLKLCHRGMGTAVGEVGRVGGERCSM